MSLQKETKIADNDLQYFFSVIVGRIADILLAILEPVIAVIAVRRIHGTIQQGRSVPRQKVYPRFCQLANLEEKEDIPLEQKQHCKTFLRI